MSDEKEVTREDEIARLRDFVTWIDTWVSHPVGSFSVYALDGLFGMARDKIAALRDSRPSRPFHGSECSSYPNCNGGCGLGCTKEMDGAGARQPEAWDAPHNRTYEPIEKRAAEIYATFVYDEAGEKPAWKPGGNSLKQDEARQKARDELRAGLVVSRPHQQSPEEDNG